MPDPKPPKLIPPPGCPDDLAPPVVTGWQPLKGGRES